MRVRRDFLAFLVLSAKLSRTFLFVLQITRDRLKSIRVEKHISVATSRESLRGTYEVNNLSVRVHVYTL